MGQNPSPWRTHTPKYTHPHSLWGRSDLCIEHSQSHSRAHAAHWKLKRKLGPICTPNTYICCPYSRWAHHKSLRINPHTLAVSQLRPLWRAVICVVTSASSAIPHTYRLTHTHKICIQFTCRLVVTPAQLLTVCQTQACPWVKSIFHCHHHPLHLFFPSSFFLSIFMPPYQAPIFHFLSSPLSSIEPQPTGMRFACFSCTGLRTVHLASGNIFLYIKAALHQVIPSCFDLYDLVSASLKYQRSSGSCWEKPVLRVVCGIHSLWSRANDDT